MNLRALPKIDLHRHLEGSVRFETFCELARDVGIDLPRRELRRRTTMRGEKPGFLTFLSKFALYRGLYPSRDWIERVAFEAAEDARKDGVVYLELRFSTAHFARRMKAKGEDVASWIAKGARRAGIDVRFIATFARDFSLRENEPTTRAVRGTDLFSGLDVAGNEARSALPFLALFRELGLPATIHAGEAGGPDNVREAIERFGARRIGHGLRILENPDLVRLALRLEVHFEVCLTSEVQTGAAASWRTHPGRQLVQEGLRVSLNTDDPSICGVQVTNELARAARAGWARGELRTAMAGSSLAAFMPSAQKRALARRVRDAWKA